MPKKGVEQPLRILEYESTKDHEGKELKIKKDAKKVSLRDQLDSQEINELLEKKGKELRQKIF